MPKVNNLSKNPIFEKLTKEHGGVVNLASFLGVSVSSVSGWLRDPKAKVPIKHAINIEILTKGVVKARSLRSDVMKNYELVAR